MGMRLESIVINLQDYGPSKGCYVGNCRFKGEYGATEIVLAPTVSAEVLKLCANALVENARNLAQNISAQIIEQSGTLLEDKGD